MSSKKGNPSPRRHHRGSHANELIEEARGGEQASVMGRGGGGQHGALLAELRPAGEASDGRFVSSWLRLAPMSGSTTSQTTMRPLKWPNRYRPRDVVRPP